MLLTTQETITERAVAELRLPVFHPGTILLAMYGSIGVASIAGLPTSSNQAILGIQPGSDLDGDYLWLYLQLLMPSLAALGRGGTQRNINASMVRGLPIPLPTLDRQRRLAARLAGDAASATQLRDAASAAHEARTDLQAATLARAFGGITPLATDRLGSTPRSWRWAQLTSLGRLESGHTPSRSRPDWWSGDIPWIQLADIRAVDGQVIHATSETTNPGGIAHSAARILPADTVVMSRTASVGFVARMGRPMATSQDFVNWVCGPDLDPEFLMHLLIRSRDYIRSLSAGAIHKTVYYPTVKDFHVCIPAIAEQRRIAGELRERLATIDQMTRAIDTQLEAIEALPAALLRRAFAEIEAA